MCFIIEDRGVHLSIIEEDAYNEYKYKVDDYNEYKYDDNEYLIFCRKKYVFHRTSD